MLISCDRTYQFPRRTWQPTPVFLPGESPWTEKPDKLQSIALQSRTQLKWLSTHTWQNPYDLWSLKCLLSEPLQKKFTNSWPPHIVFMMANFDLLRCRHNILPLNTLACITWEYNLIVISKISVNFQVIMFFIVFLFCFYYFGGWWYHLTFYVCMCKHIFYYSWVNTLEWDCWILWKVFV